MVNVTFYRGKAFKTGVYQLKMGSKHNILKKTYAEAAFPNHVLLCECIENRSVL